MTENVVEDKEAADAASMQHFNADGLSVKEAVHLAAYHLLNLGQWPSALLVRGLLGRGSNTTITAELKIWNQDFLEKMRGKAASISGAPANMPSGWDLRLVEAAKVFFDTARGIEREMLDGERALFRNEIAEAHQAVEAAKSEALEGANRLDSVTKELEGERRLRASVEASLEHTREQLVSTNRQLVDAAEKIRRLQMEMETFKDELVRQREIAVEQLAAERVARSEEVQQLEKAHQEQLSSLADEAKRREDLAYERLNGMRVQMAEETAAQREEFGRERTRLELEMARLNKTAADREADLRAKISDAERRASEYKGQCVALSAVVARLSVTEAPAVIEPASPPSSRELSSAELNEARKKAQSMLKDGVVMTDVLMFLQDECSCTYSEAEALIKSLKNP